MCSYVALSAWLPFYGFHWKHILGTLLKNLFGKPSFVKIGPKVSRCLLEDLSMLQCIRPHYVAIKALPFKEDESGCLCSRRVIRIMRTPHNVTYNVPCRLVLNWPAVDLLTFVHCIYQHRRSRDWSVFLSPGRVTLDGMLHRRIYTICFCTQRYGIDVANFTQCCSATHIFVMVMPIRCLPQ